MLEQDQAAGPLVKGSVVMRPIANNSMQQTGAYSLGTATQMSDDRGEFDVAMMRPVVASRHEARRRAGIMSQNAKRQPAISVLRAS